ncbi:MAG: zf-TFIIB domain-containing protein [Armatimonadetes bacterium]|nr:zf-TFIIB domain-containing protein [Armatimonadota bacterium]
MKCPNCEVIELTMADRTGVEIDYCTVCRGVWLDRGELDKIIDRSATTSDTSERIAERSLPSHRSGGEHRRHDDDDRDDHRGRRNKRGGFLGELFDF